jgi:hypothetical protein
MAKAPLSNQHSRRLTTRNQSDNDQTRQRRHQHRVPPKRSVSSLSAIQLERKRANDREAQRLIRQRTKDRIDGLEKQIADLRNENERLNRCLRQRTLRETEVFRKRNNHEAGSNAWSCSKVTESPCGRQIHSHSESDPHGMSINTSDFGGLADDIVVLNCIQAAPAEFYAHIEPESFSMASTAPTSQDLPPLDMSSSAYCWGASTAGSSTDGSIGESQDQYQRAVPTPGYSSLMTSYYDHPISPPALHCVLPNGQLHILPPRNQTEEFITRQVGYFGDRISV